MNKIEKKIYETLIDLKENHHVIGVKAEFEAEGTRMEEALRLKEIVTKAGLELTIKIGGCEAIKDLFEARTIGVNTIVAPMIETPYAFKKFVNATKYVFPQEEWNDINFFISLAVKLVIIFSSNLLESIKLSLNIFFLFCNSKIRSSIVPLQINLITSTVFNCPIL